MASELNCYEVACLMGGDHHHTARDLTPQNKNNPFAAFNVTTDNVVDQHFMHQIYCVAIRRNINPPPRHILQHGMKYVGDYFKCKSFKNLQVLSPWNK